MNGWAWVLAGYGVTIVSIALYARSLAVRRARLEKRLVERP
ncbi:MAG TPA: CcmD family protein [Acidimicrobiia bacterium]|jgi:CcmD family protein